MRYLMERSTRNLISFTVALSFNGNDIKMNYNGEVSGNEIKFIRTVEGGGQTRRRQRFTAKRSST